MKVASFINLRRSFQYCNKYITFFSGCDTSTNSRIHIPARAREDPAAVTELSIEAIGESARGWRCTDQEAQAGQSRSVFHFCTIQSFLLYFLVSTTVSIFYLLSGSGLSYIKFLNDLSPKWNRTFSVKLKRRTMKRPN